MNSEEAAAAQKEALLLQKLYEFSLKIEAHYNRFSELTDRDVTQGNLAKSIIHDLNEFASELEAAGNIEFPHVKDVTTLAQKLVKWSEHAKYWYAFMEFVRLLME